jgi:parvulin-like peptidyl-prolyl isomerase
MARLLLSFLLTVFFTLGAKAEIVDYIVAVVNGSPILYSELLEYAKNNRIRDLRKARDSMIERKILVMEAEKKGITVSEEELKSAILDLIKRGNYSSEEAFKESLQKEGISMEDVKRELKEQLLMAKLIAREVKSKVEVTDIDVKKACKAKGSLARRQVYYIYTKSREKIEKVLSALKSGARFEDLAKTYSEDPTTAGRGGYIGSLPKGSLIKPLDSVVWSLKPGTYKMVELRRGYYVVYVKSEEVVGCNEEEVRRKLFMEKFQKRLNDYIEELKKRASVKVYL